MSYTPTNWVNGETPINADNLNKIEQQLVADSENIDKMEQDLTGNAEKLSKVEQDLATTAENLNKMNQTITENAENVNRMEQEFTENLEKMDQEFAESLNKVEQDISDNAEKLTEVEQTVTELDKRYTECKEEYAGYTVDVPKLSEYAKVNKLGGMTYKVNTGTEEEPAYELRSAPVTEVESVGANLIPKFTGSSKNGVTIAVDKNGVITLDGNCTASGNISMNCPTIPKGKYCFSDSVQGTFPDNGQSRTQLMFSDGSIFSIGNNNTSSTALAFEINEELSYSLRIRVESGHTYSNCKLYPMLNRGTEALPYKPYVRNTLPIPEAVQALDGYGEGINESVYNYVDFEKKQFVRNVGKVDFGTLNWSYKSNYSKFESNVINNMKLPLGNYTLPTNLIIDKYTVVTPITTNDKSLDMVVSISLNGEILIRNNSYTDATTFKAAMSGIMLYYELATPVITDISDLLTDNTIPVEGGGTLTFKNEYEYDVPSEVVWVKNFYDIMAGKAVCDENGNNIAEMFERLKALEAEISALKAKNV